MQSRSSVIDLAGEARGVYSLREASKYAEIPYMTLRYWFRGTKDRPPLRPLQGESLSTGILSFQDLVESIAIRFLRVDRGISMHHIRDAVAQARQDYGVDYPFSDRRHQLVIDRGKRIHIYLEGRGDPVQLGGNTSGQSSMHRVVGPFMERLYFDQSSFQAYAYQPAEYEGRKILLDPSYLMGAPRAEGAPYSAPALWRAVNSEGSEERVADLFDVDVRAVRASYQYCRDIGLAA